jgi:DNA-binding beta-propeller fold protein YncE
VPVAPGCTTSTASDLPGPRTFASKTTKLTGVPLAMQHSTDSHYTFVTLPNAIEVLRNQGSLSLTPLRTLHVPGAGTGLLVTPDDHYLIAAAGSGAVILSVANAESGKGNPILGKLTSPHGSGAATSVLSANNQYLFITLENSGTVAVFNFAAALSSGLHNSHFIGYIPAGVQPVGLRLAVDQNYMYVTSLRHTPGKLPQEGMLRVIDVPDAEKDPAKSVKASVNAGCAPERVYAEQSAVWVTARDSNALLAFSAGKLLSDPSHSIEAVVKVGAAPVGLTPLNDARIVVADSGSTSGHGAGNVLIVSNASALAGKSALLALIPAEGQPFQLTRIQGLNTLLVTDQGTNQLLALNVAALP